ncbi:MAG: translation initiation factor IF-3 [Nitrospira bacterium HGW-Nitrospira-1]|nr:MAG: translation initiation factor IF-3 [Nitrospira bacterium HGW-Nitrospira-1]
MRINGQIRAREIRVIDRDGEQLGLMTVRDAIKVAEDRELDLVEVSPTAVPPVCKILDFGKYRYQLNKKHTQKKTVGIKEVKVRPRVGEHDLELKIRNINRFIEGGDKAKIVMYFRGREIIRPELGMKVFEKITQQLTGKFQIEQHPRLEGNHITMVVAPKS